MKKKSDDVQREQGYFLSLLEESLTGLRIIKAFNAREGYTRHSTLVSFNESAIKKELMHKCKNLKNLDDDNPFKKVYIKQEQPPLTRKENDRLYKQFKMLRETYKDDDNVQIKLYRGKLYNNEAVIDEFSLFNQYF